MKQIEKQASNARPWAWIPSLYFIQGLPNAVIVTLTVVLYKDFGISNAEIAFYTGLMYLPWVIKPLWSPFVDIIKSKRWWIVVMQLGLAVAMGVIAFALPTKIYFAVTVGLFWFAAFTSATNDIASDGFYILSLSEHEQSKFVGIRSLFYRISMWAVQFGLIFMAGYLQTNMGCDVQQSWIYVFALLAAIFAIGTLYHYNQLPRPNKDEHRNRLNAADILKEFGNTFVTFAKKPYLWSSLAFMLLYRLPEAQLVKMINPFLLDPVSEGGLGMTKQAVSVTYGIWGVVGLLLGGIIGGLFAARFGLKKSLQPMAWSMSLTCITFVILSQVAEPSNILINVCVFIEQFGYGFGFSAYMLYLIYFSEGEYATAHYALCTGIMAVGLMLPGMAAGWIQELLGYQNFFIWTMICCVTTIVVASIVKVNPSFGIKKKEVEN